MSDRKPSKLPGETRNWPLVWLAVLKQYAARGLPLQEARELAERDFERKLQAERKREKDGIAERSIGVYAGRRKA